MLKNTPFSNYYITTSHISSQLNNFDKQHVIRECSSTLYVGLARAVPPTNTNFRLIFLLTRLQEALYEDLPV